MHWSDFDSIDVYIITSIQKDGRKSFTDMANELQISVGTIRNRFLKLAEDKVISVFGRVDPGKIGFNAYASVQISVDDARFIPSVVEQLAAIPEASFLATTTGKFDIELNLLCLNNDHLVDVMEKSIHQIEHLVKTKTSVYLKVYKYTQPNLENLISAAEAQGS